MRLLTRALMAAAFALLATVLGAETTDVLRLWQGFKFSEVPMLKENVREFVEQWNRTHADKVDIRIEQVPFDEMVRKMKSAAPAKLLPDLAFVDANRMVQLAYGGVALPLDTLTYSDAADIERLRSEYVEGAFDTNVVTFKGATHLYGLPAQTTTLALFWNKRLFQQKEKQLREAGLDPGRAPRDWEEFIRYGKVLTDTARQVYGFGMNNSLWFTMPFLNQYGVELAKRNDEGRLVAGLAGPRGEAAIARKANFILKDGIEGGAWRDGSLNPDQGFQNEKYAMVLTGPWMIENFRSSGLDFGVALIPKVPLAEARQLGLVPADAAEGTTAAAALSAGNIGGQNLVVTATTRRPDVAYAFARYFTSEPVQRRWAEELGQIPVLRAAQQNLDLSRFPEVPVFIQQIQFARPLPPLPFAGVLETEIFNPEINLVLQGRLSPGQALRNIEQAMTKRILTPVNEAEQEWAEEN